MGGGAASSRVHSTGQVDTTTAAADESVLDYDAVQRGDAEMENRMNRLVRGCIELQERNPLISIHDQVYIYVCSKVIHIFMAEFVLFVLSID